MFVCEGERLATLPSGVAAACRDCSRMRIASSFEYGALHGMAPYLIWGFYRG